MVSAAGTGATRWPTSKWRRLLFISAAASVLLVLGILLRFTPMRINTQSMSPTLQPGDWILTDRWQPSTQVQRGDMVTFRAPTWPDEEFTSSNAGSPDAPVRPPNVGPIWVKRIIAQSSDSMSCCTAQGQWEINATVIPDSAAVDFTLNPQDEPLPPASGYKHTLSESEFFMMGDNRPVSLDSRTFHFRLNGTIRESDLTGRVVATMWPIARWEVHTSLRGLAALLVLFSSACSLGFLSAGKLDAARKNNKRRRARGAARPQGHAEDPPDTQR